jgi:hypothetical protein
MSGTVHGMCGHAMECDFQSTPVLCAQTCHSALENHGCGAQVLYFGQKELQLNACICIKALVPCRTECGMKRSSCIIWDMLALQIIITCTRLVSMVVEDFITAAYALAMHGATVVITIPVTGGVLAGKCMHTVVGICCDCTTLLAIQTL